MTALPQYDLLEAVGQYFEANATAPREVIVKFGDASLIILDTDDMPVTHWPLATLRNVSGTRDKLSVTPDQAGAERLTFDDPTMVKALRAVCPDLDENGAAPPSRWRKRAVWAAVAAVVTYLAVWQATPLISDQMADLIPPEAEMAMGDAMATQFVRQITGFEDPKFCNAPEGMRGLTHLKARLQPAPATEVPLTVRVIDHDMVNAFALPGGQIIIFRGLLTAAQTPEAVAGILARQMGHVSRQDPIRLTLRSAGTTGIFDVLLGNFASAGATSGLIEKLLTTGYTSTIEATVDDYATTLLAERGLPSRPLAGIIAKLNFEAGEAYAVQAGQQRGESTATRAARIAAADTIKGAPFEPALSDQQWVALRGICR